MQSPTPTIILITVVLTCMQSCFFDTKNRTNSTELSSAQPNESNNPLSSSDTRLTFTDTRDNQTYKMTTIGTQVWMAENLNHIVLRGSYCANNEPSYCDTYGRLYNWAAAMEIDTSYNSSEWTENDYQHQGACPDGWHIPSYNDYQILADFIIQDKNIDSVPTSLGYFLKTTSGWDTSESEGNGTDDYGFSALPGGLRDSGASFKYVDGDGYWWIATQGALYEDKAHSLYILFDRSTLYGGTNTKSTAYSIRCLQN
ncbi:MAG: hypothetical protein OCD01_09870 [Fibrobacterales bacterium]